MNACDELSVMLWKSPLDDLAQFVVFLIIQASECVRVVPSFCARARK
jgi:hypothetical protein